MNLPLTLGLGAVVALAACQHNESTSGASSSSSMRGGLVASEVAAHAVAVARCDHELACNHQRFGSHDECLTAVDRSEARDLASSGCTRGVGSDPLGACLGDIRDESCETLDPTPRMSACSPSTLCTPPRPMDRGGPDDVFGP